jgi:hypothetical protein
MWFGLTSPEQLARLTELHSLSSLQLWVEAEAAVVRSLTALQGLTHLSINGDQPAELLAAVGQLTGLVSLKLQSSKEDVPLQLLAALQQLTSLTFYGSTIDEQQARALAGLGQLRRLSAGFESPAAAAAAGLARLEECDEGQGGARVKAPGQLRTYPICLAGFDLSGVHTLQLMEAQRSGRNEEALHQQLSCCPQLRALRLEQVPCHPEALLQAILALPHLQHLFLSDINRIWIAAAWRCWPAAAGS